MLPIATGTDYSSWRWLSLLALAICSCSYWPYIAAGDNFSYWRCLLYLQ